MVEAMPAAGGGGGFNRAHPYVGVSGRTQAKRRKQLAVRWYCVSCEKSSEHEQNVVTLLCLQCGVSMVSSHRRRRLLPLSWQPVLCSVRRGGRIMRQMGMRRIRMRKCPPR